jgi:hypothetical protein
MSPAGVALDPSGALRGPTIQNAGDSADSNMVNPTLSIRQEPSVPDENLDHDAYLCDDNLREIIQHTDIAQREPNPPPWTEEPRAFQYGPLVGFSIFWLADSQASLSDTHRFVLPTPIFVLRGQKGNTSVWLTEWYPKLEAQL